MVTNYPAGIESNRRRLNFEPVLAEHLVPFLYSEDPDIRAFGDRVQAALEGGIEVKWAHLTSDHRPHADAPRFLPPVDPDGLATSREIRDKLKAFATRMRNAYFQSREPDASLTFAALTDHFIPPPLEGILITPGAPRANRRDPLVAAAPEVPTEVPASVGGPGYELSEPVIVHAVETAVSLAFSTPAVDARSLDAQEGWLVVGTSPSVHVTDVRPGDTQSWLIGGDSRPESIATQGIEAGAGELPFEPTGSYDARKPAQGALPKISLGAFLSTTTAETPEKPDDRPADGSTTLSADHSPSDASAVLEPDAHLPTTSLPSNALPLAEAGSADRLEALNGPTQPPAGFEGPIVNQQSIPLDERVPGTAGIEVFNQLATYLEDKEDKARRLFSITAEGEAGITYGEMKARIRPIDIASLIDNLTEQERTGLDRLYFNEGEKSAKTPREPEEIAASLREAEARYRAFGNFENLGINERAADGLLREIGKESGDELDFRNELASTLERMQEADRTRAYSTKGGTARNIPEGHHGTWVEEVTGHTSPTPRHIR